ncbi:MAG TPA: hypothetical protein VED84_02070 [Acidimicrobiales bacterium]|nr:hypothetical protein [Acidimicrobiales bacterium]
MGAENLLSVRRARLVAGSVVLVVGSLGLAACTSPRNGLGPNASPCFRVLAVARAAVNDSGRFAGVRYLSSRDLTAALRAMKVGKKGRFALPTALSHGHSAVCVVEYQGNYSTNGVALGWPPNRHSDPLAVVVVRVRDFHLLVTFVLKKPPLRFTRFLPPLA